jgi:hypothetical protein
VTGVPGPLSIPPEGWRSPLILWIGPFRRARRGFADEIASVGGHFRRRPMPRAYPWRGPFRIREWPLNLIAPSADIRLLGHCNFQFQRTATRHHLAWWRCRFSGVARLWKSGT